MRFRILLGPAVVLLSIGPSSLASAQPSNPSRVTGSLSVFAASSLQKSFTTLAQRFEQEHPGTHVTLSFAASDELASEIVNGAAADVFASASPKTMATVTSAHDATGGEVFATNRLEVATPPDNPAAVRSLHDLVHPDVKVGICEPEVPCGEAATGLFAKNHLRITPATYGQNVKAVLTLVELGEIDAGLVYVTDVKAAGAAVHGVEIPPDKNETSTYPISTITSSTNVRTARAFEALVLSPTGQQVLHRDGFGPG